MKSYVISSLVVLLFVSFIIFLHLLMRSPLPLCVEGRTVTDLLQVKLKKKNFHTLHYDCLVKAALIHHSRETLAATPFICTLQ